MDSSYISPQQPVVAQDTCFFLLPSSPGCLGGKTQSKWQQKHTSLPSHPKESQPKIRTSIIHCVICRNFVDGIKAYCASQLMNFRWCRVGFQLLQSERLDGRCNSSPLVGERALLISTKYQNSWKAFYLVLAHQGLQNIETKQ